MGEEEKGLVTMYAAGEPVAAAYPATAAAMKLAEITGIPHGGTMDGIKQAFMEETVDTEDLATKAEALKKSWGIIAATFRVAAEAFTELWRETAAVFVEDWLWKKAITWAEQNRRDLAGRYHHTKKRRIRKKYRKRIVVAYLEEVKGE